MSTARRLAISYSRFSDIKQARGDSEDRQDRLFRQFCTLHNLTPLTEVFADKGRSGYHDEHRRKGRLGQLVAMAKDGKFEPNTVLVVESWDRLGRLRPDKMVELVAELVRCGLGIGVCRLNDVFVEADFGTHKWTTLAVFIQLAFSESQQKAERVAASWQQRVADARQGKGAINHQRDGRLRLSHLPAWLEASGGEVRVIPERAAAVNRIFELAEAGHGCVRIVQALVREGVPPVGNSGRWQPAYVALLLADRRVLGEVQPRRAGRQKDGEPLCGFYPPIISEDMFSRAQAGRPALRGWDSRGRALASRDRLYTNVFRDLVRDCHTGAVLTLHNRRTRERPDLVLVPASARSGRASGYTLPYALFEESILGRLREVNSTDVLPKRGTAEDREASLRARLTAIRADLTALKADLERAYSKSLADVLRRREAEEEAVGQALQEERAKAARPAERAWEELPSLVDLIREGGDEARRKVRAALQRVVAGMLVLVVPRGVWRLAAVQVCFADSDATRHYLISHHPAGKHRPARWEVKSFAAPAAGGLDLRKPDHVRRAAKFLANLDLSGVNDA
jgi:DNA invertase Pin-like site-specific DNA recombinase